MANTRSGPPGHLMGLPPQEEMAWAGYRDWGQGDPRPRDVVYDPTECLKRMPDTEALVCLLKKLFERTVLYTKKVARNEPPWFARPIIKTVEVAVAANATGTIFQREIGERHRAVITALGIDVSPAQLMTDQTLEFWFDEGTADRVIPIFDDQSSQAYESTTGLALGRTSVLLGSKENPFNFMQHGLQFQIRGRKTLRFMVENKSDAAAVISGGLGYYEYWTPYGATELEDADVQP